ncbi:MAG: peroxidase-related enzyme [Thermodesulfobacteriota bacterium]
MSRFRIIEEDKATEEVKDIYKTIRRELGFGFVPNLFKSMAISPTVLRGNWEKVKFTFLSGIVPRTIKEMICVAVSAANRNNYCLKTHLHGLSMMGVDQKILQGLQGNLDELPLPERTKIIIKFALKVTLEPTAVTDKDFSELRDEGLTEEDILEIVSTANLINSLNIYADLAGVDLDERYV